MFACVSATVCIYFRMFVLQIKYDVLDLFNREYDKNNRKNNKRITKDYQHEHSFTSLLFPDFDFR